MEITDFFPWLKLFCRQSSLWCSGCRRWLRKASWLTPGLDLNRQEKYGPGDCQRRKGFWGSLPLAGVWPPTPICLWPKQWGKASTFGHFWAGSYFYLAKAQNLNGGKHCHTQYSDNISHLNQNKTAALHWNPDNSRLTLWNNLTELIRVPLVLRKWLREKCSDKIEIWFIVKAICWISDCFMSVEAQNRSASSAKRNT